MLIVGNLPRLFLSSQGTRNSLIFSFCVTNRYVTMMMMTIHDDDDEGDVVMMRMVRMAMARATEMPYCGSYGAAGASI